MNINKVVNNGEVTLKVEGRLDTTNYMDLQKIVDSLGSFENLVFDFEKLEYISSAGLRVILSAQKKCNNVHAKMVVEHLSTLVEQIFETVGFTDFINIR